MKTYLASLLAVSSLLAGAGANIIAAAAPGPSRNNTGRWPNRSSAAASAIWKHSMPKPAPPFHSYSADAMKGPQLLSSTSTRERPSGPSSICRFAVRTSVPRCSTAAAK